MLKLTLFRILRDRISDRHDQIRTDGHRAEMAIRRMEVKIVANWRYGINNALKCRRLSNAT